MAFTNINEELSAIYVGYFGRAADPSGLDYWIDNYNDYVAAGDTALDAKIKIAVSFSANTEAQDEYVFLKYPTLMSDATSIGTFIDSVYQNLFNRTADTEGKAYWTTFIQNSGDSLRVGKFILAVMNGAQDTDLYKDITTMENKGEVSLYYAQEVATEDATWTSADDLADATSVITGVTDSAATVTTAKASADTLIAADVLTSGTTTYTLTTGVDQGTAFTGGSGVDTFVASVGATGANATDTLNASDVIDGGAGTADVLNLTVTAANTAALQGALISNIETLNIRAGAATVVNASSAVGATAIVADRGTGTLLVNNLATGASITVKGNGTVVQGEVAFAPATAASAITLNFADGVAQAAGDSVTAAATIGAGNATGTATTATINSTGAANVTDVVDLANATLTSVTINAATNLTGDFLSQATDQVAATGSVTVSGAATLVTFTAALDNDIATINASGMTAGGISAALGSLVTQTVTGGAGADTITTGAVLTTGSVNAGAGTDTLVLGTNVAHANTAALAAKYTNFETLSVNGTFDASLISSITAIKLSGAVNAITGMTATQAANVTASVDIGATTLALATATGTSDVLTMTMGTGLLATEATDTGALTVTGFETLNLATNAGPTATVGAVKVSTIASFVGATLNTVNMTGTAFDLTNAGTTVAATFDASALTGDGTVAGANGLTIAGSLVAGSTVTGSAFIDAVTIGAEGTTYNMGAGADTFSATVALLVADGTTDGVINGGDGTDVITLTDTTTALTDNHFTKLSNMETLTLSNTAGDLSITTGAAFNTAFANGATITTGVMAATKDVTFNGGLSSVATTLTIDATSCVGTAVEANSITTGSGADTVTFTGDATYVGVNAAAQGTIAISTGAGADTISVTVGTLLASTGGQAISITGGTGVDTITKVGVNCTTATSTAVFVMAAGDSTTTAYDKITGFDVADGTNLSDVLDFSGVGAVGTLATSTDFGTILSHSITAGVALFDDAAVYATPLVINSTNLADVVGYLAANTATLDTVAFAYDSDNNGAADATMVFNNDTTDSLVQLVGITGVASLNATLTTATLNCVAIA